MFLFHHHKWFMINNLDSIVINHDGKKKRSMFVNQWMSKFKRVDLYWHWFTTQAVMCDISSKLMTLWLLSSCYSCFVTINPNYQSLSSGINTSLVCFLSQITAVCREAALLALQDDIKAQRVEAAHFERALDAVQPRVPDSLIQSYVSYQRQHSGLCFFWLSPPPPPPPGTLTPCEPGGSRSWSTGAVHSDFIFFFFFFLFFEWNHAVFCSRVASGLIV